MKEPFIIALDDTLSRFACLASTAGALCAGLLGWHVLGYVLMVFGGLFLWLAHEFAVAPLCPNSALPSALQPGRRTTPGRAGQD